MGPRDLPLDEFNPMSVDFAPFLSRPYSEKINTKDSKPDPSKPQVREYEPQLEMVMGCREGQIFVFDPWLMRKGRVIRYNSE